MPEKNTVFMADSNRQEEENGGHKGNGPSIERCVVEFTARVRIHRVNLQPGFESSNI